MKRSSLVAQQVEDPALLLQQLRAASAHIWSLAWEFLYAMGRGKKKKKDGWRKKDKDYRYLEWKRECPYRNYRHKNHIYINSALQLLTLGVHSPMWFNPCILLILHLVYYAAIKPARSVSILRTQH